MVRISWKKNCNVIIPYIHYKIFISAHSDNFYFWHPMLLIELISISNMGVSLIETCFCSRLYGKHTSLKKYTNCDKLICLSLYIFLLFWGNERRQKTNIPPPRDISTKNYDIWSRNSSKRGCFGQFSTGTIGVLNLSIF